MTHWAQLLHFYQPPTQTHDILRKVAEESYRPLLRVLREHSNARVAVNMQGVLTELLLEHGLGDVVDQLRRLAEMGRVEFVGTGKFHPILPLIPETQRKRSILENSDTNEKAFGAAWKPHGFFPPEMCYSAEIPVSIAESGHDWFIMSGVGCPVAWPIDKVHRVKAGASELGVLFRDDVRSNRISFRETNPQAFLEDLSGVGGNRDAYVVTAMDAETFGHHISDWEREFLAATFTQMEHQHRRGSNRVRMVLPSELTSLYPAGDVIEPRSSSWSTSNEDLGVGNPFPLWQSPGNELHDLQWDYVNHCLHLAGLAKQHATTPEAKKFSSMADDRLQPALHSCQFWWASRRPMWDVSMVHRGFLLLNEVLIDAARAVNFGSANAPAKEEAGWRVAAANEIRLAIEAELRKGIAP